MMADETPMRIVEPYRHFGSDQYLPYQADNIVTLKKMLATDTAIAYAYDFVRRGVTQRIGEYTHEDPKIQEYVRTHVEPAYLRAMKESLSAIYWGLSVGELVLQQVGSQVALRKLYVSSPDYWWSSNAIIEDEFYDPKAINPVMGESIPIFDQNGIRQLALYVYRREYSPLYGFATGKQVYPYWFIKSRMLKMYSMYMERYASPQAAITGDQGDPAKVAAAWKNLGTNSLIQLGSETDIKLLEPSHNSSDEYEAIINMMDKYLFLAFYIPKLAVDEGQYSTRAQSEVHFDVYTRTESELCSDFAENYLIEQVIKPMVIRNYGPQDDYGNIHVTDPVETTREEWMAIFKGVKDIDALIMTVDANRQLFEEKLGFAMPPVPGGAIILDKTPAEGNQNA